MPAGARRLAARLLHCHARRVLLLMCFLQAGSAASDVIVSAHYRDPTTRYAHAVLGDGIEHATLEVVLTTGNRRRFTLPDSAVFEDTMPRLVDVNGDGAVEVLVVEADQQRGARLAIYGPEGRIAATSYIGTRFRWLAPLGAADLDGDGQVEVAYIDRPHLAKTLRIWRFQSGGLIEVASFPGVTNHRIGEVDIAGGIRSCGIRPEMVVADAGWRDLLAITFDGSQVVARKIGSDTTRPAFARAMACQDGS